MAVVATSAKGILIQRQKAILQQALIDDVDRDDPTRAGLVMIGTTYEGSIDTDRIVVQVMDANPRTAESWHDTRRQAEDDLGFRYPDFSGLIGGPQFHTLRGTVKITFNFDGNGVSVPETPEEDAIQIRQTVTARARRALQTSSQLVGFFDDYGAGVHEFQVSENPEFPLQGPNYESYLRWAALVTVPRR